MLDYKPNMVLSNEEFDSVGKNPIRHDGADKVTGRARYGADNNMPGMLYGKILRSPHAHAVICDGVALGQHLDEGVERLDPPTLELDPGVRRPPRLLRRSRELRFHPVHDEAELARGLLGLGEQEPEETLRDDLADGPEERGHALLAAAGGGKPLAGAQD